MKQFIILLICLASCWSFLYSQEKTITGKVTDENGHSLPGANIIIKGTNEGEITDLDGKFSITVPSSESIIVISFIGYVNEEIKVGDQTVISISLKPSMETIDEVVVTALGISREVKSLGYARQSVSTEELAEARDPNIVNSLTGKVSGVHVISGGGPTSSTRVIIRGNASLTGNNQPLWVVDGVPIMNNMGESGDIDYGNDAADLDPDMIESMEVLKGPNAAALYGSIAQNGAIIITTKKGTSKKNLGISYSANVMFHSVNEYPAYQNVYGEGHVLRTGLGDKQRDTNDYYILGHYKRSWGAPMLGQNVVNYNGEITTYSPKPNNVKEYYQTGKSITHTVSFDRSFETGSYRLSFAYTDADDILPDHNLREKYNVSFRALKEINKYFTLDAGFMWTKDHVENRTYRNFSSRNPMNSYIFMQRNASLEDYTPWKRPDGTSTDISPDFTNPLWVMNESWNEDSRNRLIGDITMSIKFFEHLTSRIKLSEDYLQREGYDFDNWGSEYDKDKDGRYRNFYSRSYTLNFDALLTYSNEFGPVSITINAGANQRDANWIYKQQEITSLILPDKASLDNANSEKIASGHSPRRTRLQSLLGFATIGYKDFVFLDINVRNDWSSTLSIGNNSVLYPSVSLSALYSDMFNLRDDIFSFGKFRLSYAIVGNSVIEPYQLNNVYKSDDYLFNDSRWLSMNPDNRNPDLDNEKTYSWEIGMDNRLLENRLSFDITYYSQYTVNQILNIDVSRASGFNTKWINSGRIDNKGFELTLGLTPVKTGNFTWNITGNWSKNNSEVKELFEDEYGKKIERKVIGGWWNLNVYAEVGKPYGILRGNTQEYSSDGKPLISRSGSNLYLYIEDGYLGKAVPDWLGSVKNTLDYKNFDLGVLIDFRKGGIVYSTGNHKANVNGNTDITLEGREEFYFSDLILGENNDERRGDGLDGNPYTDIERVKGNLVTGYFPLIDPETNAYAVDENGNHIADGKEQNIYVLPQEYWQYADYHMEMNTFDRSFVKLREVTFGYSFPKKLMDKTPMESLRIAAVGRNLWTIFKNVPPGIEPEATTTLGNGQGIEFGSVLPTAYYGFNLKVTF